MQVDGLSAWTRAIVYVAPGPAPTQVDWMVTVSVTGPGLLRVEGATLIPIGATMNETLAYLAYANMEPPIMARAEIVAKTIAL